jgi:hypothetical protein
MMTSTSGIFLQLGKCGVALEEVAQETMEFLVGNSEKTIPIEVLNALLKSLC